jgi:probable DNA metabolism protein
VTDFVYDGSFDGFLCAARRAREATDARIVPFDSRTADLFAGEVHVPTVDAEAREVRRRVIACAGADELQTMMLVHVSAAPGRHRLLLSYLRDTLEAGRSIAADVAQPQVLAVRKIRDRVSLEIARFLGFVRFRRVAGDCFYAPVNPDADIVGLIGPHFAERFPDAALIIHDVIRGVAFWSSHETSGIADLAGLPLEVRDRLSTDCEPGAEELWRKYFTAIANPERRNPRLQRKLMPVRYREFMVERPARPSSSLNKRGDVRGAADSLKREFVFLHQEDPAPHDPQG